jgi:hypothetical protein
MALHPQGTHPRGSIIMSAKKKYPGISEVVNRDGSISHVVNYRNAQGQQRRKSFRVQREAVRFQRETVSQVQRREHVDTSRAGDRTTVAEAVRAAYALRAVGTRT